MRAELQSPNLSKDLTSRKSNIVQKIVIMVCILSSILVYTDDWARETSVLENAGDAITRNSVLTYVVHHMIHDEKEIISDSKLGRENCAIEALMSLSFHLCMVHVFGLLRYLRIQRMKWVVSRFFSQQCIIWWVLVGLIEFKLEYKLNSC